MSKLQKHLFFWGGYIILEKDNLCGFLQQSSSYSVRRGTFRMTRHIILLDVCLSQAVDCGHEGRDCWNIAAPRSKSGWSDVTPALVAYVDSKVVVVVFFSAPQLLHTLSLMFHCHVSHLPSIKPPTIIYQNTKWIKCPKWKPAFP